MAEKKAKKNLMHGQGLRQFFACYDTIKELTERGCSVTIVYEMLKKEGLITMSYSAFYDAMTQRKRKKKKGEILEKAMGTHPIREEAGAKPFRPIMPRPQELPLPDPASPPIPAVPVHPAYPAQPFLIQEHQFSIVVKPAPVEKKPMGRPRKTLQGLLDDNIEAGAQLKTQAAPVDDDPEYDEKKKRVTGKKSGKGE